MAAAANRIGGEPLAFDVNDGSATLAAMDPDERRRLYNFNDVASAIRRCRRRLEAVRR